MDDCCSGKEDVINALRTRQSSVLKIVLIINAVMFLVEFGYGWAASSTALLGDSLDMLGDALVYGFSLFVLTKNALWRAKASMLKGAIMLVFGLGVLTATILKIFNHNVPHAETMGLIGLVVLFANFICLMLLKRHQADDLNMRSVWLCSRNDIISNIGVLIAAGLVAYTHSIWPDVAIGFGISILFLKSAKLVIFEACAELKSTA